MVQRQQHMLGRDPKLHLQLLHQPDERTKLLIRGLIDGALTDDADADRVVVVPGGIRAGGVSAILLMDPAWADFDTAVRTAPAVIDHKMVTR